METQIKPTVKILTIKSVAPTDRLTDQLTDWARSGFRNQMLGQNMAGVKYWSLLSWEVGVGEWRPPNPLPNPNSPFPTRFVFSWGSPLKRSQVLLGLYLFFTVYPWCESIDSELFWIRISCSFHFASATCGTANFFILISVYLWYTAGAFWYLYTLFQLTSLSSSYN